MIFGRTTIVVLLLLIQIVILFVTFNWLADYTVFIYGAFTLLSGAVLIYIINDDQNASFKMAWIIPVLVIPVFGTLLYLFMKFQFGTKFIKRSMDDTGKIIKPLLIQNPDVLNSLQEINPNEAGLVRYLNNSAGYSIYANSSVKYFPLGEDKFKEMLIQLEAAKKFIFLEYFIVAKGYMWNSILEILKRKVNEGVEVRFMYDGTCSLFLLPYNYPKELIKFGIQCKMFSPIKPILSTHQTNRDHRKILVIDGHVAFTGGINLADEYINLEVRFGHWKDTAIMVSGDAVKSFTLMFLQMWNIKEQVPEIYENYICENVQVMKDNEDLVDNVILTDNVILADNVMPTDNNNNMSADNVKSADNGMSAGGYVMPFGDSPFDGENIGKNVYIDIINRAKNYVHIMTPYLILDDEMIAALIYAAQRDVETIIITPHIPDKVYTYLLARTYYRELLEKGVKIYEYTPGFIHAKVFTSDDEKAVVGTINLDFRSLYLHFECAAYIYRNPEIFKIEEDFQNTRLQSHEMTLEDCRKFPVVKKFLGQVLRLFAPLM
ncbi:cardiolipin synthase [[Clostridium] fimetarium]|uniref:Cardiolipin synthase n=2 Tax=[Clostridium] fimetarium TaxID=99656 RepID=A0A1I0QAR5_9FIRM|nr:cardiolipin synthase [[Clostridium] fimetarium]